MEIPLAVEVSGKIRFGKPVIKGTRVPVELILGKLAGEMGFEEVMMEYEITFPTQTLRRQSVRQLESQPGVSTNPTLNGLPLFMPKVEVFPISPAWNTAPA